LAEGRRQEGLLAGRRRGRAGPRKSFQNRSAFKIDRSPVFETQIENVTNFHLTHVQQRLF